MDSANILSILSSLSAAQPSQTVPPGADAPDVQLPGVAQAPQTNIMQAAQPPAPPPPQQDPANGIAQAAAAASPPMPKPRHSLLDTIGRISDVLAKVGGADPLYQPTLDATAARLTAAGDHARKVDADNIALATSKFDLGDKQNTAANDERSRFANVLDAINDPEDAANMPAMLQAAGLTDPKYAPFVAMVQKDPDQAKVLASALGAGSDEKLGHNLYFGTDSATGKTVAYQIGDDGHPHMLDFGGVTPGEPTKVVNTGGSNVVVGSTTGKTIKILPNSVSPNTAANNAQSNTNNERTTGTQITVAGMRGNGKGAGNSKGAVEDPNIPMYLNNIRQGFADLHNMQALPGEGGALNQVEGAFGRSALGQKLGEQAGTPAAQKRLAVVKNISQLQQAMLKSLPASATRTKFEQEMLARGLPDPAKMDFGTANTVIDQLYASYQNALKSSGASAAPSAAVAGPRLSPEQARALKPGTAFIGLDGIPRVRH